MGSWQMKRTEKIHRMIIDIIALESHGMPVASYVNFANHVSSSTRPPGINKGYGSLGIQILSSTAVSFTHE